jgi:hypothetical protein
MNLVISEESLQTAVIHLAGLCGWICYHTRDSRGSASGFPDLVLAHPTGTIVFAELKRETGRLSASQAQWLATLQASAFRLRDFDEVQGGEAPPVLLVREWRPSDWAEIEGVLRAPRGAGAGPVVFR